MPLRFFDAGNVAVQKVTWIDDVKLGIATPAGEVKVPYWLLLTRMNTVFTLDMAGQKVEFHFRVESVGDGAFR